MKVALDTNILAYAEGVNGEERRLQAADLVAALPLAATVVPVQVLGELFHLLTRKVRRPAAEARAAVLAWQDAFAVHPTTTSVLASAMDLSSSHGLASWDAVILAAAADAGCRLLLSEDMQDGFTWRGLTITNPFAAERHPLLQAVLSE
jgi:predicted nucleic acid-binding protein